MKFRLFVSFLLIAVLFSFCTKDENYMNVYAQAPVDSVVVDTTITIDVEAHIGKVSGFGCDVVYDSLQIEYIGHETYNLFDHEIIALENNKQGRLIIGFNQFNCDNPVQNIKQNVFSITFHIKLTATQQISKVYFENAEVVLCDEWVPSAWHGLDLFIRDMNKFIIRMKLRE